MILNNDGNEKLKQILSYTQTLGKEKMRVQKLEEMKVEREKRSLSSATCKEQVMSVGLRTALPWVTGHPWHIYEAPHNQP